MFHELRLSDLKMLVRDLRAHHNIRGYSRMKKESLVAELTARFVLRDGNLYLKEELAPKTFVAKTPKKTARSPDLQRNIYNYLSGLSYDVLYNTTPRVLRSDFESLAGIDMAPHKAIFRKIAEDVLRQKR